MIRSWAAVALSLGYVAFLFAVAWHGDRIARRRRPGGRPIVYALSLAVYCTSWTFYGSVGLAARTGYNFLPIYVGPILLFALGWPLVVRVIRISKAHNITSIADFIAARYGKSQMLAAAVTIVAVVGTLPYIALQLKAVSTSFLALTRDPAIALSAAAHGQPIWSDTALAVSVIMAVFAILFGTRQVEATEHHEGMILAIAFESVVKLVAFLTVGAFVTWGMFDGFADLAARISGSAGMRHLFLAGVDGPTSVTMTGLACVAVLCLPRQFHVAVVENADPADVRKAAWLFPLYLVAINIFVIPISAAGLIAFPDGAVDGDIFVLALPMAAGQSAVALLAFIGGLSAATGMVIVACVAVSTMVSNDLVMPLVLRGRPFGVTDREDMSALVLHIRRVAILTVMLLAYCFYRLVGNSVALASSGLLSFAVMAQFAPALLGGLVWRGATAKGALAGIIGGSMIWAYTLLLPALAGSGGPRYALLDDGLFGLAVLRPQQLFGLQFDPLTHGVFWSLLVNVICYVVFSLSRPPRVIERIQASAFIDFDGGQSHFGTRSWDSSVGVADLAALAAQYLGADRARRSFDEFARQRGGELPLTARADFALVRHTERLLASAIGAPSARLVIALSLERRNLNLDAALRLLDDATAAIQYNRDLLQATLENVRQGISVFDTDLRLICWNRRFRELLDLPPAFGQVGVPLEEIIRFNAARGEYGAGEPDDLVAQKLGLFIGEGETTFERQRSNGIVLEIRTSPMSWGYVTTWTDITERARATTELAAANERLEERVRERTIALTTLNEALSRARSVAEDANQGKTRFLAAASHDLLQPLNAARLYVSTLLERHSGNPVSDLDLARKIDASLRLVEDLLGTLLDISRLDAGALKPERHDFLLGQLFDNLKMEFAPLAERKGLDLRIVATSLAVESDRHLLHRVLQNLLSNALRYTPAGKVLLGVRRVASEVVIQVWDTGVGIPLEYQSLVFEEFQRFGSETEKGLGLGLSIVDRISRILDHQLNFRSRPGHGTGFSVRVPRGGKVEAVSPGGAITPRALPNLEQAVVLCVDDQMTVLDGMRALLEEWSCRVLLARGLVEAVALASAQRLRPELLIVDFHLGQSGDGVDCVDALRHAYAAHLPAVLVTADRSENIRTRALAHEISVMHKPLKPAALRAVLMRLLATRQTAEQRQLSIRAISAE